MASVICRCCGARCGKVAGVAVAAASGNLVTESGVPVGVGRRLGGGGQGEVFELVSPHRHVFKRMSDEELADPQLHARVAAMVATPPDAWREAKSGHVMLSWPTHVVVERGRFVGFLMPLMDMSQTVALHEVTNPSDRQAPAYGKEWTRGFNWRYLVATAENLALATQILHDADVVIGDFNECNVLVSSDARLE